MRLPLEEIISRTRLVAEEFSDALEVIHVLAADGEAQTARPITLKCSSPLPVAMRRRARSSN